MRPPSYLKVIVCVFVEMLDDGMEDVTSPPMLRFGALDIGDIFQKVVYFILAFLIVECRK
jgi:hypothetical protein